MSGVPEGSILESLVFNIFIGWPERVGKCTFIWSQRWHCFSRRLDWRPSAVPSNLSYPMILLEGNKCSPCCAVPSQYINIWNVVCINILCASSWCLLQAVSPSLFPCHGFVSHRRPWWDKWLHCLQIPCWSCNLVFSLFLLRQWISVLSSHFIYSSCQYGFKPVQSFPLK